MNLKSFLLAVLVVMPLISFCQSGVITVFSEDGDRFYLILNGVKQNSIPQTNVRVDGLTNDYYNGKIIFEDQSKPEITKNIYVKDQGTQQLAEATYKIKKTKDGELKLRFFSFTPTPASYNPPPDMYVVHYGQPVQQTTVTTTTTTSQPAPAPQPTNMNMNMNTGGNGNVSINMSMQDPNSGNGGVSISINGTDPNMNTNVTQTTTTKTTTSYSGNSNVNNSAPATTGCQYPMDYSSFNAAKQTLASTTFEETKLSTAKSILSANCVSSDQVVQLCSLFTFEENKLNFAKFAYSKTTDQSNYFKVVNVFTFDNSKTELNNFISNGGR